MAIRHNIVRARGMRIMHLLYGFCIFLFILALRLFYLQVENGGAFLHLGKKNFLRLEMIPPLRGDVYDCNHVLLAANRPVFDAYWQGSGQRVLSEQSQQALGVLSTIIGMDLLTGPKRAALEYAERYARRVLLKADLTFDQLCQLSEQCSLAHQLLIANRFKRIYPHQELACHVLGYLNRGENVGQSGIELQFEPVLQGQEGRLLQVINSTGKTLAQQVYKQARAGDDIALTLDFAVQQLAESLFEPDQSGVFVLMEPDTGAIRSLVSCPRFDPNVFLSPLSEEDWSAMTQNNPLLNRATNAVYPPASTFKLVTWAAGLEEHVFDQNAEINCLGYVTFCGRKYFCMKHFGHGNLLPKQALAISCNVPCFKIARKLKVDRLALYAQRFGLGQKTSFLLPEKAGLVPTNAWKKAIKGERWWTGDTFSVSIGQGYLLVTPLQVARMVSAICSGYLVKPRVLQQEAVERQRLEVSHETLSFLRGAMKEVVINGTGRMLNRIGSCDVFAKTGTAQTCSLSKEKKDKTDLEHGWFAGYFSCHGKKPLSLVVLIENAGSSRPAVLIADNFLRGYATLLERDDHAG